MTIPNLIQSFLSIFTETKQEKPMEINQGKILPTKILVREIKKTEDETRASGIIIPGTTRAKNEPTQGTVIIVGTGTEYQPMPLKEGNTVLFNPLSGQKFTFNNEELILLDSSMILYYW